MPVVVVIHYVNGVWDANYHFPNEAVAEAFVARSVRQCHLADGHVKGSYADGWVELHPGMRRELYGSVGVARFVIKTTRRPHEILRDLRHWWDRQVRRGRRTTRL